MEQEQSSTGKLREWRNSFVSPGEADVQATDSELLFRIVGISFGSWLVALPFAGTLFFGSSIAEQFTECWRRLSGAPHAGTVFCTFVLLDLFVFVTWFFPNVLMWDSRYVFSKGPIYVQRVARFMPWGLAGLVAGAIYLSFWRAGTDGVVAWAGRLNAVLLLAAWVAVYPTDVYQVWLQARFKNWNLKQWAYVSVGFLVLLFAVHGVGFAMRPVQWGNVFGPWATLFAGLTGVVTALSVLKGIAERKRWPVFPVLIALYALNSYGSWSPNRTVETSEVTTPPDVPNSFKAWLADNKDKIAACKAAKRPFPVYVVFAEGGGIRAAAQALYAMSALQDRDDGSGDRFSDHVFAVSGVSGGSVGAAQFAALLAKLGPKTSGAQFMAESVKLMREDYLSPELGRLFFTDLPASTLPIGHGAVSFDRSNALAEAIRVGWKDVEKDDSMSDSLLEFRPDSGKHGKPPYLCLNATSIELGYHRAVSNLPIGPDQPATASEAGKHTQLASLKTPDGKYLDLRLCDAAALSARFPVITDAGRIQLGDPTPSDWLIDGGYYEDTGIATAINVVNGMLSALENSPDLTDGVEIDITPIKVGSMSASTRSPLLPPPFPASFSPLYGAVNSFSSNNRLTLDSAKVLFDAAENGYKAATAQKPHTLVDIHPVKSFGYRIQGLLLGWSMSEQTSKNLADQAVQQQDLLAFEGQAQKAAANPVHGAAPAHR